VSSVEPSVSAPSSSAITTSSPHQTWIVMQRHQRRAPGTARLAATKPWGGHARSTATGSLRTRAPAARCNSLPDARDGRQVRSTVRVSLLPDRGSRAKADRVDVFHDGSSEEDGWVFDTWRMRACGVTGSGQLEGWYSDPDAPEPLIGRI